MIGGVGERKLVGRSSRATARVSGGHDDLVVCALLGLHAAEPLDRRVRQLKVGSFRKFASSNPNLSCDSGSDLVRRHSLYLNQFYPRLLAGLKLDF